MRILMMFGIGTPRACERSRTLTPDSTETGPVGGAAGGRGSRRWAASWRACRCSREGRAPPWSMTARRRRPPGPPPPRGRSGRLGLLPPLAIGHISVEAAQLRSDADLLLQDVDEPSALGRALEACEVAARVGAPPRLAAAGHECSVASGEPKQITLRRPPAAAGATPQWHASYDSSCGCSTGMPAGTSSGLAISASAAT